MASILFTGVCVLAQALSSAVPANFHRENLPVVLADQINLLSPSFQAIYGMVSFSGDCSPRFQTRQLNLDRRRQNSERGSYKRGSDIAKEVPRTAAIFIDYGKADSKKCRLSEDFSR